jgi:hypothetical protein
VKATGQPFLQHIAPDAAGTIGPVAGLETRLDRRDDLGVLDLAGAGRAVEPSMGARARYIQNFAEPADGPDVTMLCNEGEPHIASLAKKAAVGSTGQGNTFARGISRGPVAKGLSRSCVLA